MTQKLIKLIEQEEPSEEATNLSHDLAIVCRDISNNGWKFDLDKVSYWQRLRRREKYP